jgi:hypothetical protein
MVKSFAVIFGNFGYFEQAFFFLIDVEKGKRGRLLAGLLYFLK